MKYLILRLWHRIYRRGRMYLCRQLLVQYDSNFWFDPDGMYSYSNVLDGENVNFQTKRIVISELSRVIGCGRNTHQKIGFNAVSLNCGIVNTKC